MVLPRNVLTGLAMLGSAIAATSYPPYQVRNAGVPVGQLKNISGSEFKINDHVHYSLLMEHS
jgi:hypothetical protein